MRRPGRRLPVVVAGVTLAGVLTGCGGSSEAEGDADGGLDRAADLSTCTADAQPAAQPYGDAFPSDWPFPPRTVVFAVEDRGGDGTIVTGVSSAPFAAVLDHLNTDVVGAGFVIEQGETEEHDAEAEWEGNGFRGRWAIRESAQCAGETVIQVLSAAD
ncbi:hypothetical protein [Nocardioides mesophilus]|uniref:Lipoprotein n=1 Tax=Nocardioides mesophilus TaxID=433659 RepID=A0A7G9R8D5_9ACTN|nr:hypothetical protein [Nocardioides mesophilus]QNN51860.1 hypothetical protein H9L09_15150 [Nocardioides mesophilus]